SCTHTVQSNSRMSHACRLFSIITGCLMHAYCSCNNQVTHACILFSIITVCLMHADCSV
ncbi:hypothetical protein CAPTEDRAFT_113226, partial [Capitella teleta]